MVFSAVFCGHPSRLAQAGSHLRMTMKLAATLLPSAAYHQNDFFTDVE
jgi:hypothetical protein